MAALAVFAAGASTEYRGEARVDGRLVYVEKHVVQLDGAGRLLQATTRYEDPTGRPIADLESDFRTSLTVPSHVIHDHRTGNRQGLRREGDRIVLFDADPGQPERTRTLGVRDADGRMLVGCQGLNYYLLANLEHLDPTARLPLRFLIPGKLDYYDFMLQKTGESADGIVAFEIAIQNWFLRMFAPKLEVKYDKQAGHIVWYHGLSNLVDDHGNTQVVTITYQYPP
jgi:hypothetical protein